MDLLPHDLSGMSSPRLGAVEHFNITPGGKANVKSFNLGSCQPPED
jgi:hypothetical protein